MITSQLLEAYFLAQYKVYDGNNIITLKIDISSEEIIKLHNNYHVKSSAIITAYNPYSKVTNRRENIEAQNILTSIVSKQ